MASIGRKTYLKAASTERWGQHKSVSLQYAPTSSAGKHHPDPVGAFVPMERIESFAACFLREDDRITACKDDDQQRLNECPNGWEARL